MAVADYNLFRGRKLSVFAGVELFNHLRLTVHYMAEEKANNHFGFSIGGVIGGGRKR